TFPGQASPGLEDAFAAKIVDNVTSTSLSSSDSPSVFGESVTFTASVAATSGGLGIPSGTIQFRVDGSDFDSPVELVNGTASLSTDGLSAGPHTITAVYSGDGNFASSDSTAAVNVLAPSTIQGLVYVDTNNNGQVDFGETAIIGVTVTLTGINDLGHAVSRTVQTDANGVYA